jgi:hypothetical protein
LSAKNAQFEKSLKAADAGMSPTGAPQTEPNSALQSHLAEQSSTTSRLLEHNIEKLRARMAALEKLMGDDAP